MDLNTLLVPQKMPNLLYMDFSKSFNKPLSCKRFPACVISWGKTQHEETSGQSLKASDKKLAFKIIFQQSMLLNVNIWLTKFFRNHIHLVLGAWKGDMKPEASAFSYFLPPPWA